MEDRTSPTPTPDARWVLLAAILGSSMAQIDATAVNVALPILRRDLHADAVGVQWVVEGYALFLSALILVGGTLGDRFGRKLVFGIGIGIFTLASIACALSQSIEQIIVARCLQGIGGALLTPGSLALISGAYPPETRGRAIGTWSSAAIITTLVGPLLGGWLAQSFSWRYVFALNVPIAAGVIFALVKCVREEYGTKKALRIDVAGALAATAGLGAFVYGLIRLQQSQDAVAVGAAFLGAALLVLFLYIERRSPNPMLPLETFGSRVFLAANLYTLLLYACLGGSLFFVPFDLQNVHGYTPLASGAAMLPTIALIASLSPLAGGLVNRLGARFMLTCGAVIAALGFGAYAMIGVGGSYWNTFLPAALLVGLGAAMFVAPLTTTVMNAIATERAGTASGINNAVARTAGLLAIAILGLILATAFSFDYARTAPGAHISARTAGILKRERSIALTGSIPQNIPAADRRNAGALVANSYQFGFRFAMLTSALLALIAAAIAWVMLPPMGLRRPAAGHN